MGQDIYEFIPPEHRTAAMLRAARGALAKAQQRYADLENENEALKGDLEVMHNRALLAEEEATRLKAREAELIAQVDRLKTDRTRLEAAFELISKNVLDAVNSLKTRSSAEIYELASNA
jgi:predicted nuclease with TOPRIM domain